MWRWIAIPVGTLVFVMIGGALLMAADAGIKNLNKEAPGIPLLPALVGHQYFGVAVTVGVLVLVATWLVG